MGTAQMSACLGEQGQGRRRLEVYPRTPDLTPDGYCGEEARNWGQTKGNLGHQTSAHKMLGCPGAHAHSSVCTYPQDDLIYAHGFTSHLFQIYISSQPSP